MKISMIKKSIYNIIFFCVGYSRTLHSLCPYCRHYSPNNKDCPVCNNYIDNMDQMGFPPSVKLKEQWLKNFIDKVLFRIF